MALEDVKVIKKELLMDSSLKDIYTDLLFGGKQRFIIYNIIMDQLWDKYNELIKYW